jgi:metal transporter CNNM
MGLDSTNLKVLSSSGTPQQQHDARAVLSLLSRGRHWVLVSLLLGNVLVNETLPVFLDSITGGGGLWAILISAALIVIFGEVGGLWAVPISPALIVVLLTGPPSSPVR